MIPYSRAIAPTAGGGIDQAAIGRDVVERDQRDRPDVGSSDAGLKGASRSISPMAIGGNDLDLDAEPPGELEVGDEVRAVLGFGREDAIARVGRGSVRSPTSRERDRRPPC